MFSLTKKVSGFTLLELLIVMAIIGVLASIGIATYGTVQSKARDARRKSDLENVARALEMYRNDEGEYPTAFSFTGGSFLNPNHIDTIYMQSTPVESRGGHAYFYRGVSTGGGTNNGYQLFARLENTPPVPTVGGAPAIYSVPDVAAAPTSCGSGCNFVVQSTNATTPAAQAVH